MPAKFGLFLGEDQIPVINWVNRHGSPEDKDLRFTLPTDTKATIEANMEETFTLKRGDDSWDIRFVSLVHHGTGTNGIRAIGRVSGPAARENAPKPKKAPASIPQPSEISEVADTSAEAKHSDFADKPKTLAEKLKEKLAEKRSEREGAEAVDDAADVVAGPEGADAEE